MTRHFRQDKFEIVRPAATVGGMRRGAAALPAAVR